MKKKSVILQMFCAQRGDCESIKGTPEFCKRIGIVDEYYEKLRKKTESMPELWELFLKFRDSLDDAHIEEVETFYAEGFKFGLLIGMEAGESKFEE